MNLKALLKNPKAVNIGPRLPDKNTMLITLRPHPRTPVSIDFGIRKINNNTKSADVLFLNRLQ